MKRVVVTGIGAMSALGRSAAEFEGNLLQGQNGVTDVSLFDTADLQCKKAAEVSGYSQAEYFSEKELPFYDRFAQFAVLSAREAAGQANLTLVDGFSARSAVLYGTGIGGQETQEQAYYRIFVEGAKRLQPFTLPKLIPSAAASLISMDLGITGPAIGITSACSSSGHSIILGMMMIQSGLVDLVLAGGAEAPITYGSVKAWESLRVLAKDCCRPFSIKRGGIILGEGAATLVLESLEHAQARGAEILTEIVGSGMSSDAHHVLRPTVEGPAMAMLNALKSSNIQPTDVQYLNAHGSGTDQNDRVETKAIHQVFGQHASSLAISSTKSMHGHTLGAASALETIATIIALRRQTAPATMNYLGAGPECDLDYVPNEARAMPIKYAMTNSFAFGGLNVSLVLR